MRRREMAVALLLAALSPATLAAQPQTTDQLIKFFQSRVARDPDDVFSYNKLGAVYVQKARESGDLTYYALAEKAAGGPRSWCLRGLPPPPRPRSSPSSITPGTS